MTEKDRQTDRQRKREEGIKGRGVELCKIAGFSISHLLFFNVVQAQIVVVFRWKFFNLYADANADADAADTNACYRIIHIKTAVIQEDHSRRYN